MRACLSSRFLAGPSFQWSRLHTWVFFIAGTVPVGDMHLLASTNQKAYAAFISRQWKNMCSTVSPHITQRGQFRTTSTNPCRDSLSLVGSALFRSRHLNPLIVLFARIDSQVVFQASLNCSSPSPHFAATLFANFPLSFFLRNHLYKPRAVHSFGSPPWGSPVSIAYFSAFAAHSPKPCGLVLVSFLNSSLDPAQPFLRISATLSSASNLCFASTIQHGFSFKLIDHIPLLLLWKAQLLSFQLTLPCLGCQLYPVRLLTGV